MAHNCHIYEFSTVWVDRVVLTILTVKEMSIFFNQESHTVNKRSCKKQQKKQKNPKKSCTYVFTWMSQGSLKGQAILQVVALELEDKLDRPGPGLVETLVENLSQDDHCWQRFCSVLKVINLQSLWLLHFVSQSWKEIQSILVVRNVLIRNKLVLRNHFPSIYFIRIRNIWR